MIAELFGIAAIGATAAYALDPQFRNDVNTAIASATGAASTSTSQPQSTSTTASNIGAGWQQIMADLAQLFQNQQQLQSELSTSSTQPPPVNITYPSNNSSSNSSTNSLLSAYLTYLEEQGSNSSSSGSSSSGSSSSGSSSSGSSSSGSSSSGSTQMQPSPSSPEAILSSYITQNPSNNSGYTTSGAITQNPSGSNSVTGYLFGTIPTGYISSSTGQIGGFYSPSSLSQSISSNTKSSSNISPIQSSNSASGFSVAAAKAAGYTVTPNANAPGGYVLSTGGQQLNIYGTPIS